MQKLLLVCGAAGIALSSPSLAQGGAPYPVGYPDYNALGATSRAVGIANGEILQVLRADDYRFTGTTSFTVGSPLVAEIAGFEAVIQDEDVNTVENFDVIFFEEDVAQTGQGLDFPDPATKAGTAGGAIPGPNAVGTTPPGGTALIGVTFVTPVQLSEAGSIFFGVEVPANANAGSLTAPDGLSVQVIVGEDLGPPFTTFDLGGPDAIVIPNGTFTLARDLSVANPTFAYAGFAAQRGMDVYTNNAGMALTAITNQTTLPTSNMAPGTQSFFSGLNPDASTNPQNIGRADELGVIYTREPGDAVTLLLDLNPFNTAAPLQINQILPGSTGLLGLSTPVSIPIGMAQPVMIGGGALARTVGQVSFSLPMLTANQRALLGPGIGLFAQTIGFEGSSLTFHASNAGAWRF